MERAPPCDFSTQGPSGSTTDDSQQTDFCSDNAGVGVAIKWDPCGRDGPRRCEPKVSKEWSAESLAKYIKSVAAQIEANVQNSCLPTVEKLDAFVFRLVANTHRLMRHAPKKARHTLQSLFSLRFQRFWNFMHNEKVSATTPEELIAGLTSVIEGLVSDVGVNIDNLAQPQPTRNGATSRRFPN